MSEFPFNHLDDVSFNLALYELAHGPVRFNNDRLECLYFNPISNCNTVISSDIDPDSNFLNLTSKCSYYNEQELNDLIGNKKDAINFSLLHLNARSLLKNFDKFTQLLDSSQHEFSAIGISETWLNDINEDYVNITGFRFISSNRVGRLGGGAGLYLRDTFNFNIMSDLCSSNSALFDSVFVEIENLYGKNFIACVASVSVWFRSKEKPRNGILGFGRAKNETRARLKTLLSVQFIVLLLLICMNSWNLFTNCFIG